jgi:hypothetical protein
MNPRSFLSRTRKSSFRNQTTEKRRGWPQHVYRPRRSCKRTRIAGVVMLLVVPIEEAAAKRLGILDAAKAL